MLLLENKDFSEFIALLSLHGVKFLIVGGHAVTFHGYARFTADLDLWVATDKANAMLVSEALEKFGFRNIFDANDFSKPGYAIQLGRPPYRIDILTSIDGVEFADAYSKRKILKAGGLEMPFIGLDELLVNKRTTGRLHDLNDAEQLIQVSHPKGVRTKTRKTVKPKKSK